MASVTNDKNEKTMAEEQLPGDAEEPRDEHEEKSPPRGPTPREATTAGGGGFFTIHKKGQGYWTRICTAAAAGLLLLLTANFIWQQLPPWITSWMTPSDTKAPVDANAIATTARNITLAVCAVVSIGLAWLFWYLMNKPGNVDFLIATDSEMKKVNWTSKHELIGSTKVVIFFMFLIALILFILDMYFTRVFYLLGVLVADSPMWDYAGNLAGTAARPVKVGLDIIMGIIVFGGAAWAVYGASKTR
jgi:preprotein translocase SecE subunit